MTKYDIMETIEYVLKAHGEQKYGGFPYIVHLILVARHFTDPEKQTIALLHDILEDTNVTSAELLYIYGAAITDIVETLTRKENETYGEYIRKIKQSPLATEIKIADMEENIFMGKYMSERSGLSSRYTDAMKILRGEKE